MTLKGRVALRLVIILPLLAAVLFLPAGTLRFWQAWAFLGIFLGFNWFLLQHFYRRDPRLLERRLQMKERDPGQRLFKVFWLPLWICVLTVPGFDHRFGWSRAWTGGVPVWLTVLCQAALLCSWLLIFQVFRYNTFASTVVQVEADQKVASTGPYRIVRHPMYAAIALMALVVPFALGSYAAVPFGILQLPLLMVRLRNEERVLRRDLQGYAEYCSRTRFRLIPGVW